MNGNILENSGSSQMYYLNSVNYPDQSLQIDILVNPNRILLLYGCNSPTIFLLFLKLICWLQFFIQPSTIFKLFVVHIYSLEKGFT